MIDPDAADAHEAARLEAEEAAAYAAASFRIRSRGDGTSRGSFVLPDAQASMLKAALEAICNPRRHATGDPAVGDPAVGDRAVGDRAGGDPAGGDRAVGDRAGGDRAGGDRAGGDRAVGDRAVGDRAGGDRAGGDPDPDEAPVAYPQRMGRALSALTEHLPTDALPQAGGINATVVVNLDLDQLVSGLGSATLSTGEVISASQARRMACSAGIIPAVFGGSSLPLDLGRRRRLHNTAQRTALAVVQQGCIFGECDRPAAWCETHHPIPWSRAAPPTWTPAPCCAPDITTASTPTGRRVIIDDHGIPHTIPPTSIDPARRSRTHPRFRQPPPRHGPHRTRNH